MDFHLWLAFLAATVVLMLIPGPNVAVIVANSLGYGLRQGLVTVAGTSTAIVVQLAVAGLGLCTILGRLGDWFATLRWAGVVYLIYLGIRQWRAALTDLTASSSGPRSTAFSFRRALAVSLPNPKTLFFYGAFFPQFIAPEAKAAPQVMVLAVTFFVTAVIVDSGWALLASRARPLVARHRRLPNRISGGMLIGAGAALAFARRS